MKTTRTLCVLLFSIAALTVMGCASSSFSTDADAGVDAQIESATPDATPDVATDLPTIDVRPDAPPPDVVDVVDVPRDNTPLPGDTVVFVVASARLDTNTPTTVPRFGFNVDGHFSTGSEPESCTYPDHLSSLDTDQNTPSGCTPGSAGCRGGVDNQLPAVIAAIGPTIGLTDLATLVNDEIMNNRIVLLVRVSGIDDVMNDSTVRVQVVEGFPTFTTGCTSVVPDREYRVSSSSLLPGGRTIEDAIFSVDGSIVDGRLRVAGGAGSTVVFPLPLMGTGTLNLTLQNVMMRFDITRTSGTRGNFGGIVPGDDLVRTLAADFPMYRTVIEALLRSLIDVRLGGICSSSSGGMLRYGGMSMGFGFTLVPVRIDATMPVASGPVAGACG